MIPPISELLEYNNPPVFRRYTKDFPNNKLSSLEAFQELVKYFWLCERHALDEKKSPDDKNLHFSCAIHAEMSEIDDMWHTFLLFTKDYMTFCHNFFGKYIHHFPTPDDEESNDQEFELDFNRYLSYIYDNLGPETVMLWFNPLLDNEEDSEESYPESITATV